MKKNFGTLVALAAITAKIAVPHAALAQEVSELQEQCEYIWENRDDRNTFAARAGPASGRKR